MCVVCIYVCVCECVLDEKKIIIFAAVAVVVERLFLTIRMMSILRVCFESVTCLSGFILWLVYVVVECVADMQFIYE